MSEFWNARYAGEEYVYGTQPNVLLRSTLAQLKPGKICLPGDGEGRNAVYAARLGWDVYAMDASEVGKVKALTLADAAGVSIQFETSTYEDFNPASEAFDAVGLVFTHAIPHVRKVLHDKVIQALKPGGTLIAMYFSVDQLGKNTGGPGRLDMLYTLETLQEDFKQLTVETLEKKR